MNSKIANFSFFLAFPAFFFANVAMSANILPSFGVFSVAAAISLSYYLTFGLISSLKAAGSSQGLFLVYFSLFVICLIWAVAPYIMGWNINVEATLQIANLLGSWIALFFIGCFIDIENNYMKYSLWFSIIIMIYISIFYIDINYIIFNAQRVFGGEDVSTYQEMTRSGMVVSLALLSTFRGGVIQRLGWAMIFLPFVFILGARSEFFGMLLAIFAFEAVRGVRQVTNWLAIVILLTFAAIGVFINAEDLINSRQAAVLNLSTDASWQLRTEYQQIAEEQIRSEPFWGVPGGHFEGGEAGAYSHNALSAWVSFGLPGFIMYILANLASATLCAIVAANRRYVAWRWQFAFYLNISALVLILVAKPVFWPMPALGWGVLVGAILNDRMRRYRRMSPHSVPA